MLQQGHRILQKRLTIAAVLFFVSVTLLVVNDKIVHHDLYNFGLTFSETWAGPYWLNYALLYQAAIIPLTLYCEDPWLFLFSEVFVLTATQDILFFVLVGRFPTEVWWWTPLPGWTTEFQFALSAISLTCVGFARTYFLNKKRATSAS